MPPIFVSRHLARHLLVLSISDSDYFYCLFRDDRYASPQRRSTSRHSLPLPLKQRHYLILFIFPAFMFCRVCLREGSTMARSDTLVLEFVSVPPTSHTPGAFSSFKRSIEFLCCLPVMDTSLVCVLFFHHCVSPFPSFSDGIRTMVPPIILFPCVGADTNCHVSSYFQGSARLAMLDWLSIAGR